MVVIETCTRCDKSNTHISYLTLLDQEACEGEMVLEKAVVLKYSASTVNRQEGRDVLIIAPQTQLLYSSCLDCPREIRGSLSLKTQHDPLT